MKENRTIVVGAGPAGCFAAETLKKQYPDVEVYVLERLSEVGKRVCGEAMGRKGLEEIKVQLPSECIMRNTEKVLYRLGDEEKLRNIPGYMIDRSELNKYFAQRAESEGCIIRTSCQVMDIKRTNGMWKVKSSDMRSGADIFDMCNLIIGADGSQSSVAMHTGVVTKRKRRRWLKGHVYGFQNKIKTSRRDEELLFDFTPIPNPGVKYCYRFYHHQDLTNVGIIIDSNRIRGYNEPRQLLENFIRRIGIEDYDVVEKVAGQIPSGGPLPRTYDDGVMIVGDAAGQTNPIFYGGITPALICGKIAGEVGAIAYQSGDLSREILKEYERRWRGKPLGDPVLLEGKNILEKKRSGLEVSEDELKIYSKALDITKLYW